MKNPALVILSVVAGIGIVAAIGLFAAINANLLSTYDFATMEMVGPSPLLALIPLGIGLIAGVGAVVLWGTQRQRT